MAGKELFGSEIYAPAFSVKVVQGTSEIRSESITGIEINEDLENPGMFRISLHEHFDVSSQTFTWLDNKAIKTGTELLIGFGYASSPKPAYFQGKIKAHSPGFFAAGNPTFSIEGYDLSFDLNKTQKKFKDKKVSYDVVARDIAVNSGLKPDGIETGGEEQPKIERKPNENDHALLKRLAGEIGYEFFVREKSLYFRVPKEKMDPVMDFEYGLNFISFTPRLTTALLVNEVMVTAWDEENKKEISETARISDVKGTGGVPDLDSIIEESQGEPTTVKIENRVVRSRKEAKDLATAELKRRNRGFIEGTLECIGDPNLRPGSVVKISKVGALFSGSYYIVKARHVIGDGGYKTTLDVRRCAL